MKKTSVIKISIKKINTGGAHIFVRGEIENKKIIWLIDTGASQSILDKNFISGILNNPKIIKTEHQTTGLGASYANSEFIRLYDFFIGDMKLNRSTFGLLDLSVVNSSYDLIKMKHIHGIIGGDILLKHKAVLNYENKTMRLKEK